MAWANNISRKDRENAVKEQFKPLVQIDSEAFDLISYFRIQYVVIFRRWLLQTLTQTMTLMSKMMKICHFN